VEESWKTLKITLKPYERDGERKDANKEFSILGDNEELI